MGLSGECWGCQVNSKPFSRVLHSYKLAHPRIHKAPIHKTRISPPAHRHKTPISSLGSIFQPRLQRGMKQVPGEVFFGCSETNRQINKEINPRSCLTIAFVACVLQESLIKQDAFRFWGLQLSFKGGFISSLQVLYSWTSQVVLLPSLPVFLGFFFPFKNVDIIRRLTFLSFAIALNSDSILVPGPKMV